MDGRSATALAAARDAFPSACGPGRSDRSTGILQHYYVLPLFALVRFGRWREILEDTLPPDVDEPYPRAIWHYARGTAYARTGRIAEARREQERSRGSPPIRRCSERGSRTSIRRTRSCASPRSRSPPTSPPPKAPDAPSRSSWTRPPIEDALAYDEPHLWLAPTRHALGAALLAAGRAADAERAYREDLRHYPGNGWSLIGLAEAQRRQGHADAARETGRRFRIAWRNAHVTLPGLRLRSLASRSPSAATAAATRSQVECHAGMLSLARGAAAESSMRGAKRCVSTGPRMDVTSTMMRTPLSIRLSSSGWPAALKVR